MSYYYKCSRCRGRNVFKQKVGFNKKIERCRHCQYGNFYVDKRMQYRDDYCIDTACVHYKHRFRSSVCIHHPDAELIIRTTRYGENREDVLADIARKKSEEENQVAQAENTVAA